MKATLVPLGNQQPFGGFWSIWLDIKRLKELKLKDSPTPLKDKLRHLRECG
jgi:hypothetical protein